MSIRNSNNIINDGDIMSDFIIIGAGLVFIGIFTSPWLIPIGILVAMVGLAGD
jgi:hypothetical protein